MEKYDILIQKIDNDIKKILSEKRYKHSVDVMEKSEELAIKYNVDVEKAKLVGLAHDIAKEMPEEEKIKYVNDNNIEIDNIEKYNVELLHAKIGADICEKKYGFSKDMVDAIKYHTVGNSEMDILAKVLLIADKTEDGRTYINLDKIKQTDNISINEQLIFVLDISIKHTIDKGRIVHPDSIYTRNRFLLEK